MSCWVGLVEVGRLKSVTVRSYVLLLRWTGVVSILLVQALVCPGGGNVIDVADALHVFLEKGPDADRVLASFGPLHLVLQGVGSFQSHGRQNLSTVGSFLVERLVDFEGK